MKKPVFYRRLLILIIKTLLVSRIYAGPPFFTDDPEPVKYKHFEFYISSAQQFSKSEIDATLPHFEINYGVLPEVQLHLLAPMDFSHTSEGNNYQYSNTEFGIKYRFVKETDDLPQIGTFPIIEIPTEKNSQANTSSLQAFFPIWLQKSFGKFTAYGGAGVWLNSGKDKKNSIFTGFEAQYDFSEILTIGTEIYFHTSDQTQTGSTAGFSLGGYINLDSYNHILFSFGHFTGSDNLVTGYIGYQLTI
jgi:hypothetical protein